MRWSLQIAGCALAVCAVCHAGEPAALRLELAGSGFASPVFAIAPPGARQRLAVLEQNGRIRLLHHGKIVSPAFLDIMDRVTSGGERGLLGLAFHPNYLSNGRFYVNYTATSSGQLVTRVSRFRVIGDPAQSVIADPESEYIVLEFAQPFSNHNGGMIAFGPDDGFLYIASGDGGSGNDPGNRGQLLTTLLGKMLRIDVDNETPSEGLRYAIPASNPFVQLESLRHEIWAYGLRNPWRFSFDPMDGAMYIADVGQNQREEVNFLASGDGGVNFGWRYFEGTRCNTGTNSPNPQVDCTQWEPLVRPPVFELLHTDGHCSITGGYVYRGERLEGWEGAYFFADYCSARVFAMRLGAGKGEANVTEVTSDLDPGRLLQSVTSFGVDNAGEIYLTITPGGTVYRIASEDEAFGAASAGLASGLMDVFSQADGNGDGLLSFAEAAGAQVSLTLAGFRVLDASGDGQLSVAELRQVAGGGPLHAGDTDGSGGVGLGEILRVIQFFNSGGLACAENPGATEDGFTPLGLDQTCLPHAIDYAPQDWKVDFSELLRWIQFYNSNGYTACPAGEDGYCPQAPI